MLICSMKITIIRMNTIIGDILSNLRNILCVSMIRPTPPAPTKPNIMLALMHSSKIYKKYYKKLGNTCGKADE